MNKAELIEKMAQALFDKENIYDTEIAPLMTKIIEICKQNEIPMIASFCYKSSEETGQDFCTTSIPIIKTMWMPEAYNDCRKHLMRKPVFFAFTVTKGDKPK